MNEEFKILVIDDEEDYCEVLALILQAEGYLTRTCTKSKEVVDLLKKEEFDLVISDLIMPEMDGLALLKAVKRVRPNLYFIILTAYGTIENAVKAMKQGAFTYVIKGSDPEELIREVRHVEKLKRLEKKAEERDNDPGKEYMLDSKNESYRDILVMASKAAKSDANILILGESGSGKEVLAQFIHRESKRSGKQFLATNCHTFTDSLLESELFGHEKGSFTGAANTRIGRFEAAQAGTLFLDEIGDIPLATQATLLRAIETKRINRIGSNEEIKVDFRLISATNKDLKAEIREGRFREDLFYRLSTIILQVPPLRERKEDLPELIRYFLESAQRSLGFETIKMDSEVRDFLLHYHYPGNIRELKNMVERLVVLSDDGVIDKSSISNLMEKNEAEEWDGFSDHHYSLKDLRREVESKYIVSILKKNQYSMTKTARDLDISTRHLFNKIAEYGIKDHSIKGESEDEE